MARKKTPPKLLNLTQASKELGVTRRAIRKHFSDAPELNHGTAHRPQVDLEELRAWRQANCSDAKRHGSASHLAGSGDGASVDSGEDVPPVTDGISYNEARRRREVLRARNEEIVYQQKSGELIPATEALELVNGAARFLREGWQTRARRLGTKLAEAKTSRERTRMLVAEYDDLLNDLADRYGG